MILDRVWRTAPRDLLFDVARKARGVSFDYSLNAVLRSTKHMHAVALIDRWERYWRIIEASGPAPDRTAFDFEGKNVFELGCGPILGWGPMAIFLGANEYFYDEPAARPEVARSEIMRERYFRLFHRELAANYGPRMEFQEFHEKCMNRCRPLSLSDAGWAGEIDLFLSNSVLEHVPADQLEALISQLVEMSSAAGHYFHAVDFGPHGQVSEFDDLYRKSRVEISENELINLLKPSEISSAIKLAGSGCDIVPYKILPVEQGKLHEFWRNYSRQDIACGVAFFLGAMHQTDAPAGIS
jgi:hypothetical protein